DPEDPDQPVDPEDPDTPVDPEPVMITLYYVNNQGWEEVAAYAWNDEGEIAGWPGELATKTDLTAKGYDVYSYTFDASKAVSIIFNNNNNGSQTTDLTIDPSKPYFYIDQWYASLEDIEALVSVEEVAAFAIYATNGTIYADCEFAIYNLIGIDVTAQNGSLNGKYIVKTEKGSKLISVW
ncbi:MAG: starch-binding protein, partial [Paludibacteraceae bacterium]|nr:starch-binding protein [Paludibacteraceae bacterium]